MRGWLKVTLAKQVLKDYRPDQDLFPSYHIPNVRQNARDKFANELEQVRKAYEASKRETADA